MGQSANFLDTRYKAEVGYWVVVGGIEDPAIVLRNPVTGAKDVVVIGSPNHQEMELIGDQEALRTLEHHVNTGCITPPEEG